MENFFYFTVIPKPQTNLEDPVTFRPISLLPSLSKIVKRFIIIRSQLHDYLDKHNTYQSWIYTIYLALTPTIITANFYALLAPETLSKI